MPVYFIRAGRDGLVKIGWARNPRRRLETLQAGNHVRLELIREVAGDRPTEAWLHRHFSGQLVDREWFTFTPSMLTVEAPPSSEIVVFARTMSDEWPFICSVARRVRPDVSERTLAKWRQRGAPHWLQAAALKAAHAAGRDLSDADFGPRVAERGQGRAA